MRRHKNKIIAGAVILIVLSGAWFFGGNHTGRGGIESSAPPSVALSENTEPEQTIHTGVSDEAPASQSGESDGDSADKTPEPSAMPTESPGTTVSKSAAPADDTESTETPDNTASPETAEPSSTLPETAEPETSQAQDRDNYLTDPIPDGKPAPVEPQDAVMGDGSFTVKLSVRCDTLLDNMNLLNKEKHELVPDDGIIFPLNEVTVYEGESVFNILQREMRRNSIHMTFRNTPIYNSAYIEAINNLYEFDAGDLSGWMYKVNDWFPNYGCSRYQLKPGDVVEWIYTCDLGRDIGGDWAASGGQGDE